MRQRVPLLLIVLLWLCALAMGEWALLGFELSPGKPAAATETWPRESRLSRSSVTFELLLFAHPRCPCTRATIGELALLMAQCSENIRARVLFFRPADAKDEWTETDIFRAAAAIPGVTALWDDGGIEANRFGARTSGQVFLYDFEAQLRFQGGITSSRGHAGDNGGRQAICDILAGAPGRTECPVFGCPLENICPFEEGVPCKN